MSLTLDRPGQTSLDIVLAEARGWLGDRLDGPMLPCGEQHSHGEDTQTPVMPDAVVFAETPEEVGAAAGALPSVSHSRGAVRGRDVAGGACDAGAGRHLARPDADEPGAGGECGGYGLPHPAGGHAAAAERAPAGPGAVLSGGSWLRMHHRRDVRDPSFGDGGGALRDHPGERAGAAGGAARWAADPYRRGACGSRRQATT